MTTPEDWAKHLRRLGDLHALQENLGLSGVPVETVEVMTELADLADTPPGAALPYIDPEQFSDDPTARDNAGFFNAVSLGLLR
jgi:hypothetical protein